MALTPNTRDKPLAVLFQVTKRNPLEMMTNMEVASHFSQRHSREHKGSEEVEETQTSKVLWSALATHNNWSCQALGQALQGAMAPSRPVLKKC